MNTAWFCGTFDPVHLAHLRVASHILEEFQLDSIGFLPSGQPPNKLNQSVSPAAIRLELLGLAIAHEPRFFISTIETDRQGPSYMIDTIAILKSVYPIEAPVLMMGSDNLASLSTWKSWQQLIEQSRLIVFRKDYSDLVLPGFLQPWSGHIRFSSAPLLDISSTDIRRRIREGEPVDFLLSDPVKSRIFERQYYH
ncbi:MAG: nicotinate (nicotinamide) nucleotide adenylyltransferase [Bacteroidetes bacterium]|nr:nicotinate (nicotinamide) nucleotide adenylyltransferase [Bacteroidota bacterium]